MDIDVSVNVALGDEVNLTGYGLQARLDGDFNVAVRSPNPPQLTGEIRVVKGTYKQYGQNLLVEDGQILFVGPVDRTRLNIDAVREIDGEERVAGLHIEGPIADPEVTLFTDPADKTQESILSYIVLGRDISETSDQESNLLASAALALTLKGSRGIATDVADKLGIRDFALDARGRGDDTEVVVSGRVSDRVLLRYGQSVFDSQSTLYLRYDITRKLYLEAAQGVENARWICSIRSRSDERLWHAGIPPRKPDERQTDRHRTQHENQPDLRGSMTNSPNTPAHRYIDTPEALDALCQGNSPARPILYSTPNSCASAPIDPSCAWCRSSTRIPSPASIP